jgi:2,3-bisphosphoglycerate-independent phosphoglycerate mutase
MLEKNGFSRKGPLVLIIMDGVGIGRKNKYNALHKARTLFLDTLPRSKLSTKLKAHGSFVGLPNNYIMGNSEVGHNAIGAGRIVKQRGLIAKEAILGKSLFQTKKWKALVKKVGKNTLHLIGLVSDGYVHSHMSHLIGLLKGSVASGIKKVRVHALLDGRDMPPQSSLKYIDKLEKELKKIDKKGFDYRIASGGGRMHVTMDRYESDWNVVKRGWRAHVCGIGEGYYKSAMEAIIHARRINPRISDQYLPSFVIIDDKGDPVGRMNDNDCVLFFNFRGDRAIMISQAFDDQRFNKFKKDCNPRVNYYGLLQYDDKLLIPKNYLLDPPVILNTITDYLCKERVRQYSISETHKFGHIKYFFLGNRDKSPCPRLDKYVEVRSDPTEMIKDNPEMKAFEVKEALIKAIKSGRHDFLKVNFVNGDMVGHTGSFSAAMIAAKTVDKCVREVVQTVKEEGGIAIVTADHGNLEQMDPAFITSHTLNPVIFSIIDKDYNGEYVINDKLKNPCLGNIAATILNLLGYKKPKDYLKSLIKFLM